MSSIEDIQKMAAGRFQTTGEFKNLFKEAFKEAFKEILNEKLAEFGWLSFKTIAIIIISGAIYLSFILDGWHK